mgnify:CR=1 FL=1
MPPLRNPIARSSRRLLAVVGLLTAYPFTSVGQQVGPTSTEPRGNPMKDVRYVVIHSAGPRWEPGKSFFQQPGLELHIAHYRQLLEQGKLLAGGPFPQGPAGGMMIPEPGVSEQEITEFANADPAVKSGLLNVEIRPWLVGMKK